MSESSDVALEDDERWSPDCPLQGAFDGVGLLLAIE